MSAGYHSDKLLDLLLIEDDECFADLVKGILARSQRRFRLQWVDNLTDGLPLLDTENFDLILLDLVLPNSSGLDTFLRVRSQAESSAIIVLSGIDDEQVALEAVQRGAQDYLVKGRFDGDSLVRAIVYAMERQQLLRRLGESEERYSLAAAGANDGLWDWKITEDVVYFSPRWKSMLGFDDSEIGASFQDWTRLIHPDDLERFDSELTLHLRDVTSHFQCEYRIRHRDGTYLWMLARGLAVREPSGRVTRMAGSQTDITSQKLAEAKLAFDAHHDALTALPNRKLLLKRLSRLVDQNRRRRDRLFAVLFIDFDRFKRVNDSLGHEVGDELLIALAQRLQECVRPGDLVARLGGDEFAILLDELNEPVDAIRVAERIHEKMKPAIAVQGHALSTSASIGIALGGNYDRPADILRDADNAMYRAKMQGRGKYVVFDAQMHDHAVHVLRMENDLRAAMELQQFELHYQPIVSLKEGHIAGFEALIRWRHPEQGLLSPAEFIPVAEESGLIVPIGDWVLRTACAWICQMQKEFPRRRLSINVNLSARQVAEGRLTGVFKQVITETGVDPNQIVIRVEITETALMEGTETVTTTLLELKNLGLHLCIDDFGTGYSSLSYLHRFPIDVLKIDRSFIDRLGISRENSDLVRTIVTLAHCVGVAVVAEGIESREQAASLREMNCEFGQGFLYSKPLPGDRARQLLEQKIAYPQ